MNNAFTRAEFNAYSSHLVNGVEKIPNHIRKNYKNKVSRGNYEAAYNVISQYIPYYKRNNLANLVGQYANHPLRSHPRYNAKRMTIERNNNAKRRILNARAGNSKQMISILQPYRGGKGGVQLGYLNNRINKNPIKYAMINKATKKLYGFALLENKNTLNSPKSRYLDIIGALRGYGLPLLTKIIENAKRNNKNTLNLKAVVTKASTVGRHTVPLNNMGKLNDLVKFYKNKANFEIVGYVNSGGLQPMTRYLQPKNNVETFRKARKDARNRLIAASVTPRVTRGSAATPARRRP
jgi:hypothetical protein